MQTPRIGRFTDINQVGNLVAFSGDFRLNRGVGIGSILIQSANIATICNVQSLPTARGDRIQISCSSKVNKCTILVGYRCSCSIIIITNYRRIPFCCITGVFNGQVTDGNFRAISCCVCAIAKHAVKTAVTRIRNRVPIANHIQLLTRDIDAAGQGDVFSNVNFSCIVSSGCINRISQLGFVEYQFTACTIHIRISFRNILAIRIERIIKIVLSF